jgi:hypothetical protein
VEKVSYRSIEEGKGTFLARGFRASPLRWPYYLCEPIVLVLARILKDYLVQNSSALPS